MICPECSCDELVLLESVQTCMHFSDFEDENGKWHHHDENRGRKDYRCQGCAREFSTPKYNSCWCGWTSQYPVLSKSHKEEHQRPFKGFKSTGYAITNNEWILNLVKNIE
jgi:hypothetical protein